MGAWKYAESELLKSFETMMLVEMHRSLNILFEQIGWRNI